MNGARVALVRQPHAVYPERAPFHPGECFPELPAGVELDPTNAVYGTVRDSFRALGLDREHAGTAAWNPLGSLVRPGDTVFVKPNMISHRHRLREGEWDYVTTHGAVIRAVIDYVFLALRGEGRIWLGDAPQTDSVWSGILAHMGLYEIADWYRARHGFAIEVLDLRDEHHVEQDGIYVETVALPGDPRGGVSFDLGEQSMFRPLDVQKRRYYGAYYDWAETNVHHHGGRHEYRISRSPLEADVFIGVPKLKTHKKCGLTLNLKGLVGINADKNWLPHYAFGAPGSRGDQFEHDSLRGRLENAVVQPAKQLLLQNLPWFKSLARRTKQVGYDVFGDTEAVVRSGNWHGNDTVWRMCLDLNRILMFGRPDGTLRDAASPKRFFSVVDGIVAMDGNGPVAGDRREAGVVIAGSDPVAVDAVGARLMGFDPQRLALLREAFAAHRWPLTPHAERALEVVSNVPAWDGPLAHWRLADTLRFRPHFGWVGAIEWQE